MTPVNISDRIIIPVYSTGDGLLMALYGLSRYPKAQLPGWNRHDSSRHQQPSATRKMVQLRGFADK